MIDNDDGDVDVDDVDRIGLLVVTFMEMIISMLMKVLLWLMSVVVNILMPTMLMIVMIIMVINMMTIMMTIHVARVLIISRCSYCFCCCC